MQPLGADASTAPATDRTFTTLEANGAAPVLVAKNPLLKLNTQTWTNWLCDLDCTGTATSTGLYNAVGVKPDTYGGCKNLTLVANFATVGTVTIFDDDNYAIGDVESTSVKTDGTTASGGSAAISSDAVAATASDPAVKAVVYTITASQKDDIYLVWTVTYPEGVIYDNVTLKLTSTDGQRTYNVGNINGVSTSSATPPVTTGKFTLKVSEYVKGGYNAKISAWSSVKPNDPYTANVVLTIVD